MTPVPVHASGHQRVYQVHCTLRPGIRYPVRVPVYFQALKSPPQNPQNLILRTVKGSSQIGNYSYCTKLQQEVNSIFHRAIRQLVNTSRLGQIKTCVKVIRHCDDRAFILLSSSIENAKPRPLYRCMRSKYTPTPIAASFSSICIDKSTHLKGGGSLCSLTDGDSANDVVHPIPKFVP